MAQITTKESINGWARLSTVLAAAGMGFKGTHAKRLTVINNNAGVAYLHFTNSGNQPTTADDGIPIGTASPNVAYTEENVDLTATWINTAGAQDIIISALGA